MSHTLVSLACHAYGIAAVLYLTYLVRQSEALATAGRVLVGGGLVLHGVALFELLGAQAGRPWDWPRASPRWPSCCWPSSSRWTCATAGPSSARSSPRWR
ncbi:hypothetical protein ACLESO_47005 [Pyxidicoccus sp. 3LG]